MKFRKRVKLLTKLSTKLLTFLFTQNLLFKKVHFHKWEVKSSARIIDYSDGSYDGNPKTTTLSECVYCGETRVEEINDFNT